jgi:Protein of unknown function (DUF4238)
MSPPVELDGRFVNWMNRLNAGEESLPNCEGSRHHYVAQFQLKRFRGGGKLYELDKQTGEVKETTPKEAAWDRDLYKVVSKSGDHDGVIEGFFSLAETFAREALDGLVRDGENLTEHDRSDLAFLAAIQEQRAPGFLDELKIGIRQAALTKFAVDLTNVKGKKREEAIETRDALIKGRIMLEPPYQEALTQAILVLTATWLAINLLPWTVLKAKPGHLFVCSDRPLTMHDPTPPFPWSAPAWESSPLVESTLPLGRDLCLRIGPSQPKRLSMKETTRQVDRINLRTYGWATRYVYGPSADLLERLYERADEAPRPIRKRLVMLEDADRADPAAADRNAARGWPRYIGIEDDQGNIRQVSYEVIDTDDDARRSVSPHAVA